MRAPFTRGEPELGSLFTSAEEEDAEDVAVPGEAEELVVGAEEGGVASIAPSVCLETENQSLPPDAISESTIGGSARITDIASAGFFESKLLEAVRPIPFTSILVAAEEEAEAAEEELEAEAEAEAARGTGMLYCCSSDSS